MKQRDGIFALASGKGIAGVAVIRVSGEQSFAVAQKLTGLKKLTPRHAHYVTFRDNEGQPIDQGLLIAFPGPHSFTGEDVAELHVHGSKAVLNTLSRAIQRLHIRPAEPGEFTKRAFANGKLDLTETEALSDLLVAETELQRREAVMQLQGGIREQCDTWKKQLLSLMAELEAPLDFADEDLPMQNPEKLQDQLDQIRGEVNALLQRSQGAERLREGFRIALVGPPNAGKSSLLNYFAERDAAIVTDVPGTTRDLVEVQLDLDGYPITMVDTAGLRDSDDVVEQEGIRRARVVAEEADVVLHLQDITTIDEEPFTEWLPNAIPVVTKSDQQNVPEMSKISREILLSFPQNKEQSGDNIVQQNPQKHAVEISVKSGAGLTELRTTILEKLSVLYTPSPTPAMTRVRQQQWLEKMLDALPQRIAVDMPELVADDVRHAVQCLGRILGTVDVEEMLDVLFAEFCIGK